MRFSSPYNYPYYGVNEFGLHREYPLLSSFCQTIYAATPDWQWDSVYHELINITNAGHHVMLKIKWMPNNDLPKTREDLVRYCDAVGRISERFQSIPLDICFGNEPNWHNYTAEYVQMESGWAAHVISRAASSWTSDNRLFIVPMATFCGNQKYISSREVSDGSPWADYFANFLSILPTYKIPWEGVVLHSYGRVGSDGTLNNGADEPFTDVRDRQGWRWGSNVLETWLECLQATQYKDALIYIGECNTRTDGTSRHSYPAGWLLNFVKRCHELIPAERWAGLAYFRDYDKDRTWPDESLEWAHDNLEVANFDLTALLNRNGIEIASGDWTSNDTDITDKWAKNEGESSE